MRQKKIGYMLLMMWICFLGCRTPALGQSIETPEVEKTEVQKQQIIDYQVNFFNWDEINQLQEDLKGSMPSFTTFNLKEEVVGLIKGEKRFSLQTVLNAIGILLFEEIGVFIKLGVRFILIVLLCNLLETLSTSFKTKNTAKVSFFVCYIVVLYSVIQSFFIMVELARDAVDKMSGIMFACIPSLLAFMTTSGYVSSAASIAPVIIGGLNLSTYVIKTIVFPCIVSIVVLDVISTMSDEFKIDKLIQLFYKSMKWALRAIVAISIGILSIYKMTLPYVDTTVKKAALNISTTFIPVIGDAVGGAVDFVVNCSFLVKNAFSVGVIIWIIVIVSLPLIKILAYVVVYHVAAAAIEPIGDKKMAHIATKLAKGCEFIMSSVGIITILCIVVLLICISVGGNMI
ncbi:stage III sporulation protein AE [Cellulosilyticum sp. I15G10I2]|uniref:stage III sporulation protein AE n=1 Tax=Cellulosilyticum sp. I15G10I2 TaxID=1892843 RepID=UPI00085CB6B6|nr:stage III sporulation protein AE [Cellulosilyticum sp. I15G10I2]